MEIYNVFLSSNEQKFDFSSFHKMFSTCPYIRSRMREGGEGDRGSYRRAGGAPPGAEGGDKTADAGPGAAPLEFRGGYGRGKSAQ